MFKKLKNLNLVKVFNLQGRERQLIFAVAVVLLLLINYLISNFSLRWDLSQGRANTLSEASKKIVRNLDDIVNIKFFVSSDLPTRLIPLKTDVTDLLSEYDKEGGNKTAVKILDPKKDQNAGKEAKEAGVPELQFSQLERDKYAVSTAYFGIVLSYGDKKEVLPQVTELESLEYNLTSSIYKLTRKDLIKIGIVGVAGSVETGQDNIANLRKILSQQFNLENLNISSESAIKEIDPSVKGVMVFADGSKVYDENEIRLLQNYLDKKGRIIVFADGVTVSENLTSSEANHGLFVFLEKNGIKLEKNLVLSASAELVNFGDGQMSLLLAYPFWYRTNNFKNEGIFSNVNQLTFPWSSSLTLGKKNNLDIKTLVKTLKNSWAQKDNFVLNPQEIPPPQEKDIREFTVVAEAENKSGGRMIVIPSSRFVQDRFLVPSSGNTELVLNMLNDLASENALSGIRSRAVAFYPLPELSEQQKEIFRYANILLLPVLFAIYGALRLMRRR